MLAVSETEGNGVVIVAFGKVGSFSFIVEQKAAGVLWPPAVVLPTGWGLLNSGARQI